MCENKSQNINYVKTDKKGSVKVQTFSMSKIKNIF